MQQRLRHIALSHQGLTRLRPFGKGIQATKHALEHLGYIQIDTLSVVERAHHHTLWSRIPDYRPEYLHQLVRQRDAFEYWFHAASYLPMRDYRFALPNMAAIKRGESRHYANADTRYMRHVYDRIRIDGPLKARDFQSTTKRKGQWWDWKPSKLALEKLFMQGDLMITGRDGMEKVYDLTERVLPDTINTTEPSLAEFCEYLLECSLNAHGFTTVKQLLHLRSGNDLRKTMGAVLQQKVEQGSVTEHNVDGMPTLYARQATLEKKIKLPASNIRLLSPFDNAIIHRDRVEQLFGFNYRLECYTPKQQRQFGYFCLPILYKGNLVGRVDCKAHRKNRQLELIHLHIDSKLTNIGSFIPHFVKLVHRFAVFNNCHSTSLSAASPKKWTALFRRELKAFEQ